ncbi:hypothetical protein [Shewanella nanhaiensis]|uniref:NERD domain-containing protein n=1 Tax=Shewanella nanhaiensis TaxID=2864872 RepID=A0ABS7E751_9GAMM|nr:hypothetical protein [Shewanella nanhaiensis]MBW8185508.1 hypothetical protein [Shewanella nanhaiensis]
MTILQVRRELASFKKISVIISEAKGMQEVKASKSEVETSIKALGSNLERNRYSEAVAITLSLLLWDADAAIARLRRSGLLRASRYKFRSKGLEMVLDSALELLKQIQCRPDRLKYLVSLRVLLKAAPHAYKLHQGLLTRLKTRKTIVLKTLLVLVNELFVNYKPVTPNLDSDQFESLGAEDAAQAFSYILNLMREEIGVTPNCWIHVDDHLCGRFDNIYTNLLIDAAKLNEFIEVETLIEGMPYEISENGQNLMVFSTDKSFEMSIRLGYIQAEIQGAIRVQGVVKHLYKPDSGCQTMNEFMASAFQAGMDELVINILHPKERLVFAMPMSKGFFSPIMSDSFFLEEIPDVMGTGIDNFLNEDEDPCKIRISENLNIVDMTKVKRLFSFVSTAFEEKLKGIEDEENCRILKVRSVIPVIRHDALLQKLMMIFPQNKAEEMIKILTLEENEGFIDIQYKPFIKSGEYYIVSPALVARSNLSRNTIIANRMRSKLLKKPDPMQNAVAIALRETGFRVKEEFDFNINGMRETDIFCWLDGHLFVFECKNSYHPCSAHELKTSYEHIKKAEEQLDIRLNWLKTPENQAKLFMALGWDIPITKYIHTGVVTANRLFTGYTKGDHPVRQAHELINVILRGQIGRDPLPAINFWKGLKFSVTDLVDYLDGGSIVHMQMSQLQPFEKNIQLGDVSLKLCSYIMNLPQSSQGKEPFDNLDK